MQYTVESTQQFGSNVVGFQLDMGEQGWYIIGFYLTPNNTSTIESVIAVLKERPQVLELMVAGDLNSNMEQPEGYWREEDIVAALTVAGLEDMSSHFLLRLRPCRWDGKKWSMVRLER